MTDGDSKHALRVSIGGHVQTIFGKINVSMTLRGVACDANFFVSVLLCFC